MHYYNLVPNKIADVVWNLGDDCDKPWCVQNPHVNIFRGKLICATMTNIIQHNVKYSIDRLIKMILSDEQKMVKNFLFHRKPMKIQAPNSGCFEILTQLRLALTNDHSSPPSAHYSPPGYNFIPPKLLTSFCTIYCTSSSASTSEGPYRRSQTLFWTLNTWMIQNFVFITWV